MKRVALNIGFVTNSSSCIHHVPRELLKHPKVQAFFQAFELEKGVVGENVWHRAYCTTIAMTKEQKAELSRQLHSEEYGSSVTVDVESDDVVVIYGDEYTSVALSFMQLLHEVVKDPKYKHFRFDGQSFN